MAPRGTLAPYLPDDITFYTHQVEGVRRMAGMRHVLLADEMGLGKTLQTLATFCLDVKRKLSWKMIVVCPASLKPNWEEECEKFLEGVHVTMLSSKSRVDAREKKIEAFRAIEGKPKILICNYEQLANHLPSLNRCLFDVAAFDEAHYMKNPDAKRTQNAMQLWSKRNILITGSPLLNNVHELYPLLQKLEVEKLPTYYGFQNKFLVFGGFRGKQIVDTQNLDILQAMLKPYVIRRTKDEAIDLPPVQYIQRVVALHGLQEKYYNEVKKTKKLTTVKGEVIDCENSLMRFLRLKQITGTTAAVPDEDRDVSHKLDQAAEDAYEIMRCGHRVVAFTQFLDVQSSFVKRIKAYGQLRFGENTGNRKPTAKTPPIYILNGSVPVEERQKIIRAWSLSNEPGVLVCTFKVAGVGLNMTAARHALFLDKLFVPALNQQAVDRLHRIGQSESQPVQVLEYFCAGTVELRIEKLLKTKQRIFDALLNHDDPNLHAILRRVLDEEDEHEAA